MSELEQQTAEEIAAGKWPSWPFTRLTPEQVRQLARTRNEQRRAALDNVEPAPF